jgi:hypothetical protein
MTMQICCMNGGDDDALSPPLLVSYCFNASDLSKDLSLVQISSTNILVNRMARYSEGNIENFAGGTNITA